MPPIQGSRSLRQNSGASPVTEPVEAARKDLMKEWLLQRVDSAAGFLAEDVVDVAEGLFEHGGASGPSVAGAARKWKREGGGGSATEDNEGKEDGTRPALRSAWTSFSSLPSAGSVVQDFTFSWSRRPAAPGTQPPRLTPVVQERATARATSATSSGSTKGKPMV